MNTRQILRCSLIIIAALVLVYLLNEYNKQNQLEEFKAEQAVREAARSKAVARARRRMINRRNNRTKETFQVEPQASPAPPTPPAPQVPVQEEQVTEEVKQNVNVGAPKGLDSTEGVQASVNGSTSTVSAKALPQECFPKDTLLPSELLPADANSKWAQVNPAGQGEVGGQNFLNAGFHVGVNTVGQSLRNANRQLRSDPPNPTTKVSPWMQTTIEPDVNRRPLEIGA